MLLHVVNLIEEAVEDLCDRLEVLSAPPLRDVEDGALGRVEGVLRVDPVPIPDGDDLRAGVDETAKGRGPLDDLAVVLDMDGGGNGVEERREVGDAAHLVEAFAAGQLIRQGDEVSWFAAVIEVEDSLVNRPVGAVIEVVGLDVRRDLDDRIPVDEKAA